MGAPAIFEKQIEINGLHPASTLESRIQVEIKLLHPASTLKSRIQDKDIALRVLIHGAHRTSPRIVNAIHLGLDIDQHTRHSSADNPPRRLHCHKKA
jgi:hypothetical protein